MHQEREYPGRVWGTELKNPDFAAIARAYGGYGETIKRTDEFLPALDRCLTKDSFALIEVQIPTDQITSRTTLSEIRARA